MYIAETMTYQGANRLKNKLEHVWQTKHGLTFARARVVRQVNDREGRDMYVIRSNVTFDEMGYFTVQHIDRGADINGFTWET